MSGNLHRTVGAWLRRGQRLLADLSKNDRVTTPTGLVGPDDDRGAARAHSRSATRHRPKNDRHRDADAPAGPYPGDWTGDVATLDLSYRATPDGTPDAGEVVWAWVPYEEDHTRGKDRPVLVISYSPPYLLALQLTSKDHDRDAAQEAHHGRHWMDIGAGAWDRRGRPSEVRLDRVLQLNPQAVRREGSALDPGLFATVTDRLRQGW